MGANSALAKVGHLDLYSVLGVGEGAGVEQVRRGYRRRARGCHPDRCPG